MSWLNYHLASFFPGYALRREIVQRRLQRLEAHGNGRRSHDAVSGSRLRSDFLTSNQSPDATYKGDIGKLRNHVRQLEYNNGFVNGPIRRIAKNVVGQGIRFQSRVKADEQKKEIPKIDQETADGWNYLAEKYFDKWSKQADRRLMLSFYEIQKMVEKALLRDGEVLVIGRKSTRPNRLIPYCQEVLEADRLETPPEEMTNPRIRHGIEYDDEGVPLYYYILNAHPGDSLINYAANFEQVPAFNANGTKKVMHLFNPIRPEQTRGFTEFASGLKDLQDKERYMEAEKLAALEAACLTGIIETEDPSGFNAAFTVPSDNPAEYDRIHEFAPGMNHYLRPGEKYTMHNPARPNDSFDDYVGHLDRGPANGLDIPPEVFSQNWAGLNYSNARTILLQFWSTCAERQHYLIGHLCTPTWDNVARDLVWRGLLSSAGLFDRRTDDMLRSGWIPAVYRKWVDPKKEADGKKINVDNNFETLTDVAAEQGKDFDEVIEIRAREKRKIKDLEEKYDITLTPKAEGAVSAPVDLEEDGRDENEGGRTVLSFV